MKQRQHNAGQTAAASCMAAEQVTCRVELWLAVGLLVLFGGMVSEGRAADVRELSIQEFLKHEREWGRWVGKPLRIEGRYSSFSRNAMQFQKCSLFFYLPANVPSPTGKSRTVEVTGQLKDDRNTLSFQVDSLRFLPADAELHHLRQRALSPENIPTWYELGKQTIARGAFYEDIVLMKLGRETIVEALALEHAAQKEPTPDFLRKLSIKANDFKAGDPIRLQYLHESFRLAWQQGREAPRFEMSEFRKQLASELPGSLTKLDPVPDGLWKKYSQQPVVTFRQAGDETRERLARLFFLEVLREEFQRKLAESGANGEQIAEDYVRLAPEDAEYANSFREQALMFRTRNIATARRSEVLSVAQEYEKQGKPDLAAGALKTWLNRRLQQLDRAGPSDYVQVARDVEEWLEQPAQAVNILLEGIGRYPDDTGLRAQLQLRNYLLHEGEWIPKDSLVVKPENKLMQAAQAGRVVEGMSPEMVISALGSPQSLTRIASAHDTLLVWNYPEARLSIRFQRRRERNDYVVVSIQQLNR